MTWGEWLTALDTWGVDFTQRVGIKTALLMNIQEKETMQGSHCHRWGGGLLGEEVW